MHRSLLKKSRALALLMAAGLPGAPLSAQTEPEVEVQTEPEVEATPADHKIRIGGLTLGGAVRANYYLGDYASDGLAETMNRGAFGTFSLDIFRINADFAHGPWIAKLEVRFLPGYSGNNSDGYGFLHTGWLGYHFEYGAELQVGVNRVPFGPGPYGISRSWFFDQHYYAGLADDMDLGVKYAGSFDDLSFDLAYYYSDEGSYLGRNFSRDSVRYSYDVVDETGDGYEERNQFNLRAIYALGLGDLTIDLGASAQFGLLASRGDQENGVHYAFSLHPIFKWAKWTLATQLTYYRYAIDGYIDPSDDGVDNPADTLVQFGAYDFPTLLATEALIAGVSFSYRIDVDAVAWLDFVMPHIEYSSIIKTEPGFNDSKLLIVGAAWARGGWYIYTEFARSTGNDFVGAEAGYGDPTSGETNTDGVFQSNRFGANPINEWESRFNVNLGYYF